MTKTKENKNSLPFAFLKISFCLRTFGTFAFAPTTQTNRRGKVKRAKSSCTQKNKKHLEIKNIRILHPFWWRLPYC